MPGGSDKWVGRYWREQVMKPEVLPQTVHYPQLISCGNDNLSPAYRFCPKKITQKMVNLFLGNLVCKTGAYLIFHHLEEKRTAVFQYSTSQKMWLSPMESSFAVLPWCVCGIKRLATSDLFRKFNSGLKAVFGHPVVSVPTLIVQIKGFQSASEVNHLNTHQGTFWIKNATRARKQCPPEWIERLSIFVGVELDHYKDSYQ